MVREEKSLMTFLTEEAIDNSLGIKATGHFMAMPAVLNRL